MSLEHEIATLLNSHSRENHSNTPDFILARFLFECLCAYEQASRHREQWFGEALEINEGDAEWIGKEKVGI